MLYFKQIAEMDSAVLYAQYAALETAFNETIQQHPQLIPFVAQINDTRWHIPLELSDQMSRVNKKLRAHPLFPTTEIALIRSIEDTLVQRACESLPFIQF